MNTANRSWADVWVVGVISLLCVVMLYPFWQTLASSFMTEAEYLKSPLKVLVYEPTLASYIRIFTQGEIFVHLRVTVEITVIGTVCSLFFTAFSAYGLSRSFRGVSIIMFFVVMSMFLHAGLIPEYLNYRHLGLINRFAVYIVPALINPFFLIVMRQNFLEFPKEIEEAARMDGCSDFRIFFRIVLPLSTPILAAIGLFYSVNFWNTFMQSVFFISKPELKTVQEYLQQLIDNSTQMMGLMSVDSGDLPYTVDTLRMANIVVVLAPIVCVYPFLQKYFVKGMMVGSLKG